MIILPTNSVKDTGYDVDNSLIYNCEDYKTNKLCANGDITNEYVSIKKNELGIDANEACCVCGGGINEEHISPNPSSTFNEIFGDKNDFFISNMPNEKVINDIVETINDILDIKNKITSKIKKDLDGEINNIFN